MHVLVGLVDCPSTIMLATCSLLLCSLLGAARKPSSWDSRDESPRVHWGDSVAAEKRVSPVPQVPRCNRTLSSLIVTSLTCITLGKCLSWAASCPPPSIPLPEARAEWDCLTLVVHIIFGVVVGVLIALGHHRWRRRALHLPSSESGCLRKRDKWPNVWIQDALRDTEMVGRLTPLSKWYMEDATLISTEAIFCQRHRIDTPTELCSFPMMYHADDLESADTEPPSPLLCGGGDQWSLDTSSCHVISPRPPHSREKPLCDTLALCATI